MIQRREHEARGHCLYRVPDLASGNVPGRFVERVHPSHVRCHVLAVLYLVLTCVYSAASMLTHILATAWGGFQIVRRACYFWNIRLSPYVISTTPRYSTVSSAH